MKFSDGDHSYVGDLWAVHVKYEMLKREYLTNIGFLLYTLLPDMKNRAV